MKLSTRTLYAPRILLDLARHHGQGPIPSGETSLRQGISVKYLDQIVKPLKAARLVSSVRGPKGGQLLTKNPREITLGQILRLMEGEIKLGQEGKIPDPRARRDENQVRKAWQEATKALYDKLDSITLADLMAGDLSSGRCLNGNRKDPPGPGRGPAARAGKEKKG